MLGKFNCTAAQSAHRRTTSTAVFTLFILSIIYCQELELHALRELATRMQPWKYDEMIIVMCYTSKVHAFHNNYVLKQASLFIVPHADL